MNSIKYIIFGIIFSAVLFVGCAQDTTNNSKTVNQFDKMQDSTKNSITVKQLGERMKLNPELVILDVRNPYELEEYLGHIEGAVNIPVQELEKRIDELNKYRDREIAVICRSGVRSVTATNILLQNGFNAINIEGGMIKYRAEENKEQ
jgi:rhodanese-related sulfurtransferase